MKIAKKPWPKITGGAKWDAGGTKLEECGAKWDT